MNCFFVCWDGFCVPLISASYSGSLRSMYINLISFYYTYEMLDTLVDYLASLCNNVTRVLYTK